jgi:hypothetical protein
MFQAGSLFGFRNKKLGKALDGPWLIYKHWKSSVAYFEKYTQAAAERIGAMDSHVMGRLKMRLA